MNQDFHVPYRAAEMKRSSVVEKKHTLRTEQCQVQRLNMYIYTLYKRVLFCCECCCYCTISDIVQRSLPSRGERKTANFFLRRDLASHSSISHHALCSTIRTYNEGSAGKAITYKRVDPTIVCQFADIFSSDHLSTLLFNFFVIHFNVSRMASRFSIFCNWTTEFQEVPLHSNQPS